MYEVILIGSEIRGKVRAMRNGKSKRMRLLIRRGDDKPAVDQSILFESDPHPRDAGYVSFSRDWSLSSLASVTR